MQAKNSRRSPFLGLIGWVMGTLAWGCFWGPLLYIYICPSSFPIMTLHFDFHSYLRKEK